MIGTIHTEIHQGIGKISFSHPAHNSLPSHLLSKLVESISAYGSDPTVKAILLQSGGDRTFCAGANLDELLQVENENQAINFFMGFANLINAMRTCGKIIITRVQGKAVGGGVGLAAASDYCLASKWASIKLSELMLGIGPFVIGPAVERKIGLAGFSNLSLNPQEWQTAQWAKENGLFQEVFASNDQLDEYMSHFLDQISGYSPKALSALKQVLWENTETWDGLLGSRARISGKLVLTDSAQEALSRYKRD